MPWLLQLPAAVPTSLIGVLWAILGVAVAVIGILWRQNATDRRAYAEKLEKLNADHAATITKLTTDCQAETAKLRDYAQSEMAKLHERLVTRSDAAAEERIKTWQTLTVTMQASEAALRDLTRLLEVHFREGRTATEALRADLQRAINLRVEKRNS